MTCVTPTCIAPRHADASRDFDFDFFGLATNALNVRNNNNSNNNNYCRSVFVLVATNTPNGIKQSEGVV